LGYVLGQLLNAGAECWRGRGHRSDYNFADKNWNADGADIQLMLLICGGIAACANPFDF